MTDERSRLFVGTAGESVFNAEELEKMAVVDETAKKTAELSDVVYNAIADGSRHSGRTSRSLAFGVYPKIADTRCYFSNLIGITDNPYADKEYSKWHPIKRSRAKKANEIIKSLLEKYNLGDLYGIFHATKDALKVDINDGLVRFSKWEAKGGGENTESDREIVGATFEALQNVMDTYKELKEKVPERVVLYG